MIATKRKLAFFYPLVPLLFSISFILGQLNAWFNEIYVSSIYLPTVIVIITIPLLFYICNLFFKNKYKSEIFLTIFLVFFFSYSAIFNLPWTILFTIGKISFGKDHFLVLVSVIILCFVFYKLHKTKTDLSKLRLLVLRISLIAILLSLIPVSFKQSQRVKVDTIKSPLKLPAVSSLAIDKSGYPDIYFILPEDYTAPSIYKNNFNYDETGFLNFLKQNKFRVIENATSNYPKSFESIASMLNMEYLDYLSVNKSSSDYTLVNSLIEKNNVLTFLKSLGYKYYQIGSWWEPTRFNKFADKNLTDKSTKKMKVDYFLYNLADSTALSVFLRDANHDDYAITLSQFMELDKTISLPGPKFVFSHIIAPHGPYVFDKNCNYITTSITSKNTEVQNYVNQTICINQKLENTVTNILSKSKDPPIIIIVSDEGAPFIGNEIETRGDDWKNASDLTLKKKFPIFTALYLPGISAKEIKDDITPVNIFRLIFTKYFNADLPMLPNKNYIFKDLNHLYDFVDVTEKVQN